jgi:subtilisin family serine protease
VKPDLAAPAVNIKSCLAGGGYSPFTGTSLAAPFVTGSAALMMQWGIVRGNDPYLYGQRVKAFLQKGAKRDAPFNYPNNQLGYGTLCLKASLDLLKDYARVKGGWAL